MRRQVLRRSVERLLADGETVREVAYLWRRHHWMLGYTAIAFVGLFVVASIAGFDTMFSRLGLATAGAAVAATATTEYRVIARTNRGVVLFRASRIRMAARSVMTRWDDHVEIERVGSTMLANDWAIGGTRYTVAKSFETDMSRMGGRP